jgi:hypothetical protein
MRTAPESGVLQGLLRQGRARQAVSECRALPSERLRDPSVVALAREAARELAEAPATSPAEKAAQSDEARRLLGRLVVEEAVPFAAVREPLERLHRAVLLSGLEIPGVVFRGTVRPGDTLDGLMRKAWKGRVRAGYGAVLWVNSIPSPSRLRAGVVAVPEEAVRLVVSRSRHELWLLLGEVPVRSWPVCLGANGSTPVGTFVVDEMQPRPDYWPPQGKRIPFGQKGNPLGTRWMGFRDGPEAQGLGIHGTDEPGTIGKDLSQGCVRMHNADVEELFTWVTVGTEVEVRK